MSDRVEQAKIDAVIGGLASIGITASDGPEARIAGHLNVSLSTPAAFALVEACVELRARRQVEQTGLRPSSAVRVQMLKVLLETATELARSVDGGSRCIKCGSLDDRLMGGVCSICSGKRAPL